MLQHIKGQVLVHDEMNVELENAFTATSSIGSSRKIRGLRDHLTPEMVKGRETEAVLVRLYSELLSGVKEVRLAPRGSLADDVWKVDMCLYTQTGKAYLFQVKSSKDAADRALDEYPDVPCIWLDTTNPQHRLDVLVEMVEWTNGAVQIPLYVRDALAKRRTYLQKGMRTVPERVSHTMFTTPELYVLRLLLLGTSRGGQYYLR